jgi:hypothetical protein
MYEMHVQTLNSYRSIWSPRDEQHYNELAGEDEDEVDETDDDEHVEIGDAPELPDWLIAPQLSADWQDMGFASQAEHQAWLDEAVATDDYWDAAAEELGAEMAEAIQLSLEDQAARPKGTVLSPVYLAPLTLSRGTCPTV